MKAYIRHKWTPENRCARCGIERWVFGHRDIRYRTPLRQWWGGNSPCYAVSAMAKSRMERTP
jgi:hypothetical protein